MPDLMTTLRRELDEGKSREELVQGLKARGLSQATAERFADRALEERVRMQAEPASVATGDPSDLAEVGDGKDLASAARASLVGGAFWLSLGCCVTGATYLLAPPGGKFVLAYGAVVAGLLAFGRGLARWSKASVPFPLLAVLVAGALPLLGTVALVGFASWRETRRGREPVRAAAPVPSAAEIARAQEQAAIAERRAADEARQTRQSERARSALVKLRTSSHPMTVCEVSLQLGRSGVREAIPDLLVLIRDPEHTSVAICAAGALADLGELDTVLTTYLEWVDSPDPDLQRAAIGGFGELGATVAVVAMPHLERALGSTDAGRRYLAVDSLARMGEVALPLVRAAASDPSEMVRTRATAALVTLERRP